MQQLFIITTFYQACTHVHSSKSHKKAKKTKKHRKRSRSRSPSGVSLDCLFYSCIITVSLWFVKYDLVKKINHTMIILYKVISAGDHVIPSAVWNKKIISKFCFNFCNFAYQSIICNFTFFGLISNSRCALNFRIDGHFFMYVIYIQVFLWREFNTWRWFAMCSITRNPLNQMRSTRKRSLLHTKRKRHKRSRSKSPESSASESG